MKNLWWIAALVGVGAYAFGRYDEWQKRPKVPEDAPRPPIPQPKDAFAPAPSELAADYAQEWDEALTRYSIDFYPPEAEPHLTKLLPPPSVEGVSTARGCTAIAVGEDWWLGVHTRALGYLDQGLDMGNAIERTLRDYFPSCVAFNTTAVAGLRRELKEWLDAQPQRNGDEPLLTRS